MKYARMLCWVRPHEKKELKEAVNNQFPLVFAKNYDDFKNKIREGDYIVMSLSKALFGLNKLQALVRSFPSSIFHLYSLKDTEEMFYQQSLIMNEQNVIDGQYYADELRDNFLQVIPDLWKKRQSDDIHAIVL